MSDNNDQMHPQDMRNLILFAIAAILVWVTYDHYLLKPRAKALREAQEVKREAKMAEMGEVFAEYNKLRGRDEVIAEKPRVAINNEKLSGTIALVGARIDDISTKKYFKTKEQIDPVDLFSPMGAYHPRYVSFGWIDATKKQKMPDKNTRWSVAGDNTSPTLKSGETVTIYWDNGTGLRFERDITVDDQYLFTVKQRVINTSGKTVSLNPYSLMAQHGLPEDLYGRWIIHEGPIGYIDRELTEISYNKMKKEKEFREVVAPEGWIALTERYWFSGLFPEDRVGNKFRFAYVSPEDAGHIQQRYQVDVMGAAQEIASGSRFETTTRVYVGPKKLDILENYEEQFGWDHIDLAIDFGMYYFMTKPLFYLSHWLGEKAGNFGIGIILLTFVVRIFVFPLANTSYRSFASLRKVSPKMYELREKYGDNKEKLQAELVKLYEKEKVNPMAGCLPILIQIPIFFALFKVLQISIDMRHAPFYGWIDDLSAPDPTSIFNLFGLIPWDPPQFMMIGAWPCLMLVFMILQKKMSPPPQDKMQKIMMDTMPYFITYILAGFASGLVIYWTFSNALSVIQQYIIMKSMGVEPHLFKSKEQKEKEMEEMIKNQPAVHPEAEMIEHDVEEALFGDGEDEEPKQVSKPKPKKSKKR